MVQSRRMHNSQTQRKLNWASCQLIVQTSVLRQRGFKTNNAMGMHKAVNWEMLGEHQILVILIASQWKWERTCIDMNYTRNNLRHWYTYARLPEFATNLSFDLLPTLQVNSSTQRLAYA